MKKSPKQILKTKQTRFERRLAKLIQKNRKLEQKLEAVKLLARALEDVRKAGL